MIMKTRRRSTFAICIMGGLGACGGQDLEDGSNKAIGATASGVYAGVPGDFGMGKGSDIILVPDADSGWNTIPVAGLFSGDRFQSVINAPEPRITNIPSA